MKLTVAALLFVLGIHSSIAAYKTVCYFSSWAHYRNGNGKLSSEDIDPNICTHLVYAFAGLNNDFTIKTLDSWLSDDSGLGDYRKFTDLKLDNRNLKTLIGIGGWNEESARFSRMASTPNNRKTFINSLVNFIKDFEFDGVNLDWQYPANRGGLPVDKRNFVALLQELRAEFDVHQLVLGISAAGNTEIINNGYDVPEITKYVDYVSLLTYDFHGSWDIKTGMNAPLYPKKGDSGLEKTLNQDATVSLWLKKGADSSKLILGIPAYGRTFMLRNPSRNRVGDPAARPGNPGPYTQQDGYLGYNEIVEKFQYEGGWTILFDDEQQVPYAYKGDFWISFDSPESVAIKANYIKQKQLGGAMIWSLETEDFNGIYKQGSYPLIKSINHVLGGGNSTVPERTTGSEPITTTSRTPLDSPCKKEGTVRNPDDCTKYFTCLKTVQENVFQLVVNNCPAGLAYDERIEACNWIDAVPECH